MAATKGLGRIALALALSAATGCAHLPPPWQPPLPEAKAPPETGAASQGEARDERAGPRAAAGSQAPAPQGDTPNAASAGEARQPPRAAPEPSDGERLLAYFVRLGDMSEAALARERDGARRAVSAEATDYHRVRYAMVLSLSLEDGAAAGQVLELVDPIAQRPEAPLHAIALVLRSLVQQLRQLQDEHAQLARKLESLKSLERTLSDREARTQ